MKKENISTQTLLEIFEGEMTNLKRYIATLKELQPLLEKNFERIQNYKLKINIDNVREMHAKFEETANRYYVIPKWFLVISTIALMIAIIEGLILYYLVFPQL
jgi:hypothetical protein